MLLLSHQTKEHEQNCRRLPLTAASLDALVCPVQTVLVPVTLPALRDTHMSAGTLERLWAARLGFYGNAGDVNRLDNFRVVVDK